MSSQIVKPLWIVTLPNFWHILTLGRGMLWQEAHVPKVVGSNPSTIYWMDIFSHLFAVKIVMFVEKFENKQKKRPRIAHIFLKKTLGRREPSSPSTQGLHK